MLHLFEAFGGAGRTALTFGPTYSMYPQYARDTATEYQVQPRQADHSITIDQVTSEIAEHRPHLLLLASPNNPTANVVPHEVVTAACAAMAAHDLGLVVVDEAYAEFLRDPSRTALALLAEHPRLVVTRTMSKAFGFAGARVGYLAAHPAVVDALQTVRLPYHLSSLTQTAASTALDFADELLAQVDLLRQERDAMITWARSFGLAAPDSDANFVLLGRFTDRDAVWSALVNHGVLVRQTGPEGFLRVSIGTPQENQATRAALTAVLAERPELQDQA